MSLEKLLEGLKELKEKVEDETPNIAECSIKMEHLKYKLSHKVKNKRLYLTLVNIGLVNLTNFYALFGGIFEHEGDKDFLKKHLKDFDESLDCLKESVHAFIPFFLKEKDKEKSSKEDICSHKDHDNDD